ncbi:protein starmaker-like isoform X2 [Mytilus edulis]|uniref:protein starmaker-like isoform X2 n=1 Tax=Mytilus edulis TaxID=6550 RepID=UPI0039EFF600
MSNPLFTFRPTKDKLQPFEKRFSKRETTVRKWTFVRDSESVSETNIRRDSLRSNTSTRLSSASLSNLKRKSSIPAILEGVNLPSGTPEGSENGSDLNSDLSPYSQTSDILTHASLRSRTKQKVQVDSDNNVSSSSEVKTTGSDQGTITSTLDSTKESSTENIRRSPRKKPKQVNTEAVSGISRKIPKRDEDKASNNLQTVRNSTVLHVDEVSSDSTLYSQTNEETHRRSPRKRPFQSVLNSSVNNNSVMSTKISSPKMVDVNISEKSVRIELERIETADELEGENVVPNDKKVCKKLKSSYNEQALSRSTNIDDGRRSARLHKVSPINSDEDSPQKSVRSSRLQKDLSINSDEGSPQKSERNSRLQKDSPMNSDEDSPQKSVRSSRLESIDSQGQKPDINEKRRSSRLSKLDHENIDKDTLYSTSSKEMVKRPTKETTPSREKIGLKKIKTSTENVIEEKEKNLRDNEIEANEEISNDNEIEDNEEISGENYIEDNEEISRENYIEDNEEISGDDVIENNETSSRFKLNNVSGQKHVSTAVNPVNISYGENWNEGQLKNGDSESDKISKNNSKSINSDISRQQEKISKNNSKSINSDISRRQEKISKNNSKSINSDISRRQVSTEESEDLTEDQHIFSASMEETNGNKSKEDIFRTGSSDEMSTDSELRKNADPNQQTEKQNASKLSPQSKSHTNIGHQESKSNGTSFQNQQKGNENNSTLSRSSRSNEENQLGLSQNKNSSCQEDVVSMETEIDRNEQQMKPNLVNDHETKEGEEIEQEEKELSHCTEDDLVATDNEEVSSNTEQRSNNHGDHPGEIESSHHTEDNLVATDNEEVSGKKKQRSNNHGDHPREIESILVHVSSDTPARKKSVNAVKKKVRIVADEPESFNEERTVRMWKGNDRTRTKGDLIDLDIVLETINNTIEERRSGCSDSLGKKALNSLLVYTRKEITDTINKIEDLKHDKKDLSRSRKDVKMLREKLLQLQMDRTSLMKKVKTKKQTIKPKLNDISQWLTSMTRLMKVTPKTKSPRKVVYTTYGNFPFNV